MMDENQPAGVILAGGRSRRMGGQHKALLELGGRPLLAHVLERLRGQVGSLLLSCEAGAREFDAFGLPLVPDLLPGHRGPLAGLYSAMRHLAGRGYDGCLVVCPCDAPFAPRGLARVLAEASVPTGVAVAAWQGVVQPTFSIWHLRHLETVRGLLVDEGLGGPRQLLARVPHGVVEWEEAEPPPFFNVNTPADLEEARAWLDRYPR